MKPEEIDEAMALLERAVTAWKTPAVTLVALADKNPFKVLISCLLSLRTKDTTTGPAAERLFALADKPATMAQLDPGLIEEAIYPVGFYRNKARQIIAISRELVAKHAGTVPGSLEELLLFKGVGRKTANLVVTLGFGEPGICVDTHVHRICNRWGYVATRTPEETEFRLKALLPGKYWLRINDLLVTYGQNLCTPVSPWCSRCTISHLCARRAVLKSR